MEAKHTPGPWLLQIDDTLKRAYVYTPKAKQVTREKRNAVEAIDVREPVAEINPDGNTDSEVIATVTAHAGRCEQWEANARLIAAAPDMLEALDMALESLNAIDVPQEWDCRVKITAALAKAKGGAV